MEFCDFPLKSSQHCRNVVLTSDIFGCADAFSVKQNNNHLVFKFPFEWLWTWHKKTYKAVYTICTLISFRFCVLSMQTKVKTFPKFSLYPIVNIAHTKSYSILKLLVVWLLTKYTKRTLSSQTFGCVYFSATQNEDIYFKKFNYVLP